MDRNDTDDGTESPRPAVGRRAYLAGLGAVALGAAGAGTARQEDPIDDFAIDRTVNVVTELGADPSGGTPIGPLIDEYIESNTRLVFPAGTYRIETPLFHFGEGIHDFEMVSKGGEARLVFDTGSPYWLSIGGKDSYNIRYEGFVHDVSEASPAPRLQLRAADGLVVRNVRHVGLHRSDVGPFRFDVQREDGRGVIENVHAPDGAPDGAFAVGMFVGRLHTGRLEITDCSLRGFPNNGIYQANDSAGRVVVTGGQYVNNNISNVRIAGAGSAIRDVTVLVDEHHASNDRLGTNVRGIRIANGSGMTVENCDVTMAAGVPSDGGIVVNRPAGAVVVRNTRIALNGNDIIGIRAKRPDRSVVPQPAIDCTDVHITGDGIDVVENGDDRAGIEVVGRPRSRIERVCVNFPRRGRSGVVLVNCDRAAVVDSAFDVTGDAIVVNESDDVTLRGNETNAGACDPADRDGIETDPRPSATTTTATNATETNRTFVTRRANRATTTDATNGTGTTETTDAPASNATDAPESGGPGNASETTDAN